MLRTAEYCVGWMDSSIHRFMANIDPPPTSMKYALITCLDSCFEVASILSKSAALSPLKPQAEIVGKSVLVSTRRLLSAERNRQIFFGFDEVWFLPTALVKPKPRGIGLVGPTRLSPDLPAKLVSWMNDNSCTLGLGDGVGLNFVAKLQGLAKYIVNELSDSIDGNGPA